MGAVCSRPDYQVLHAWQWMHGLQVRSNSAKAGAAGRPATRNAMRLPVEAAAAAARLRPPPSLPMADHLGLCMGIEAGLVLGGGRRL